MVAEVGGRSCVTVSLVRNQIRNFVNDDVEDSFRVLNEAKNNLIDRAYCRPGSTREVLGRGDTCYVWLQ